MINFTFEIYDAKSVALFSNLIVNYRCYAHIEHFKKSKISDYVKEYLENLNDCNSIRFALGKISNKKIGFVRSQTETLNKQNIKEAKCN